MFDPSAAICFAAVAASWVLLTKKPSVLGVDADYIRPVGLLVTAVAWFAVWLWQSGVVSSIFDGLERDALCGSHVLSAEQLVQARYGAGLFLAAVKVWSVVTWERHWFALDGERWYYHFLFFTNWVLTLSSLFFLTSARACSASAAASPSSLSLLDQAAFALLFAVVPLSVLVTVVYWLAIYNPERVTTLDNLALQTTVHGGVLALVYTDFATGRIDCRPIHVLFPMAIGLLYHLFAGVLWRFTGLWFYPFLSIKGKGWPIVYVAFGLFYIIAYVPVQTVLRPALFGQ